jgi:release factor glutamine methyltransferase
MPASELRSVSFADICARLRSAGCVFAEDEAQLLLSAASSAAELASWVELRVAGFPLEHVLGWASFCGLRIEVDAGVFVPRRRTELLVDEAVALLESDRPGARPRGDSPVVVVDLCCGSGAVGAAIASRISGIELHAADMDRGAVDCARRNLARVGGQVHEGDLFAALPPAIRGRIQILAVNAPYVPTGAIGTMPPEARLHEKRLALDGGPDGLDFHRRLACGASEWLRPGGSLILETSQRQADQTSALLADVGLAVRIVHSDELDGTVVVGCGGLSGWGSDSGIGRGLG